MNQSSDWMSESRKHNRDAENEEVTVVWEEIMWSGAKFWVNRGVLWATERGSKGGQTDRKWERIYSLSSFCTDINPLNALDMHKHRFIHSSWAYIQVWTGLRKTNKDVFTVFVFHSIYFNLDLFYFRLKKFNRWKQNKKLGVKKQTNKQTPRRTTEEESLGKICC